MTKQEAEKLARVWVALCENIDPRKVFYSARLLTADDYQQAHADIVEECADIIAQEFEGEDYRD